MTVALEYRVGKRSITWPLKPSDRQVILEVRPDIKQIEGLMQRVRYITQYAKVKSPREVAVFTEGNRKVYHGNQINEADLRKKTFPGKLFKARIIYTPD